MPSIRSVGKIFTTGLLIAVTVPHPIENCYKLNKHTITIHYGDNERLADTTGESLKSGIERYIPDGIEKCIKDKNESLNTLGFENGIGQFNFRVSGNDPIRDMVDLTLGIRQEIDVDNCRGYHSRFGILLDNPFHNSEKASLSIQTQPINAILKGRNRQLRSCTTTALDWAGSGLAIVTPANQIKGVLQDGKISM